MSVREAAFTSGALRVPWHRVALVAGVVGVGAVLVVNVPGVAEVRRYRSVAAVFSHLSVTLIALGLSPRFRGWVERAAALSARRQALALMCALVGPLIVIAAGLAVAPRYGHELFTREWGIVEPLQFVLWLTASWLAFERAGCDGPGGADRRAFGLASYGCMLLALEEVDYLGIASVLVRVASVPNGRIHGHHIGGLHDIVNELGKTSLLLGLLALGVATVLVLVWCVSQELHRVIRREIWSVTSLPLAGTVGFMALAQLADIDHPALAPLLGHLAVVRRLREEPLELLAVICVNATLLAKLAPRIRPPAKPR